MVKQVVLIVDDDEMSCELLCTVVGLFGYNYTKAGNGQEAIDLINNSDKDVPDAILMDLKMPVMDGFQAARIIKTNPRAKHIPIAAVTALYTNLNLPGRDFSKTFNKPIDFRFVGEWLQSIIKDRG